MRADVAHVPPRKHRLRSDVAAILKVEVMRIATNGTYQGFKFAEKMVRKAD